VLHTAVGASLLKSLVRLSVGCHACAAGTLSLVAASADLLFCLLVCVNGTVMQHATMWCVNQFASMQLWYKQLERMIVTVNIES
jgi:hypothetical protein